MKESDANFFEQILATTPDDLVSRVLLFAYYDRGQILFSKTKRPRAHDEYLKHCKWLIANAPGHPTLTHAVTFFHLRTPKEIKEVTSLWNDAIEANPDNADVLVNGAHYFSLVSFKKAEGLWKNVLRLKSDKEDWHLDISNFYQFHAQKTAIAAHRRSAKKALEHFKLAAAIYAQLPNHWQSESPWRYSEHDLDELRKLAKRFKLKSEIAWLAEFSKTIEQKKAAGRN